MLLATTKELKPEDLSARRFADRLILTELTELKEVYKPSEIAERLKPMGIGLAAVRSLMASNPDMFAYRERRWVPAARVEGEGRPFAERIRLMTDRYAGPMPVEMISAALAADYEEDAEELSEMVERAAASDPRLVLLRSGDILHARYAFAAHDESIERAYAVNRVTEEEVTEAEKKLGKFDWRQDEAIISALDKAAPVSAKALSAAAWRQLNPQDPTQPLFFDWQTFAAELFSIPGYVYVPDGMIHKEEDAPKIIKRALRVSEKAEAVIEVEEVAPLELQKPDIKKMVDAVTKSDEALTATSLLEEHFEITPTVKTFPDDMKSVMDALKLNDKVDWVGGDRFMKAGQVPDYINELPEPFKYVKSDAMQEDGEDLIDCEMDDEGLSTSLRKLLVHPLATDVLDEADMPAPRTMPDQLRLVLKPIHRELGTFPLCQFPTGWLQPEPSKQELILITPDGEEAQVWVNQDLRLVFGFFEWWVDQPVESGAVFSLTKTARPNVLEFAWLDQTDPVVYISSQRMEELREVAGEMADATTFDILRKVMEHWPKGADFLTVLWEINVVRRTSRRLLASLLSGYPCFYQRSGSPVWHYDHKKSDQPFDKSKKKFVIEED